MGGGSKVSPAPIFVAAEDKESNKCTDAMKQDLLEMNKEKEEMYEQEV
jgi:hypothetical protein